jgi:hypothetical protein
MLNGTPQSRPGAKTLVEDWEPLKDVLRDCDQVVESLQMRKNGGD